MDLKDWKRVAEREVCRYRDRKAFLLGAQESGGQIETPRITEAAQWTAAVEYAEGYLKRRDALKARFFRELYGIDRPAGRYRGKKSVDALALKLHVAPATLYRWRSEALSLLVLAAVQTGAIRPYEIEPSEIDCR